MDRHFPKPYATPRPAPPDAAAQIHDLISKLYSLPLPVLRPNINSSPSLPGENYRPTDPVLAADYPKYTLVVDKITSILDLSLASPSNYLLQIAATTELYLSERNPATVKKEVEVGFEEGRLYSVRRRESEWQYERERRKKLVLAEQARREAREARIAEEMREIGDVE